MVHKIKTGKLSLRSVLGIALNTSAYYLRLTALTSSKRTSLKFKWADNPRRTHRPEGSNPSPSAPLLTQFCARAFTGNGMRHLGAGALIISCSRRQEQRQDNAEAPKLPTFESSCHGGDARLFSLTFICCNGRFPRD